MASAIGTAAVLWLAIQTLAVVLRYGFRIHWIGLGWLSVSVQTQLLNRKIYSLGRRNHKELRQWFGLGVLFAGMLGISSAFILIRELCQAIRWADQASTVVGGGTSSEWALVVAVPGLTVPWSHAIYLWIATAISFGMHEAGHALAAAAEGVGIHYVAAFSIVLLPGALVALDTETMAVLSPTRTLKIICGGVWHNVVLCALCWLVALMLPLLLLPAYSTGKGAVVSFILEQSPLASHLGPADLITGVNDCKIRDQADWMRCMTHLPGIDPSTNYSDPTAFTASQLLDLMANPTTSQGLGYCVPQDLQAHGVSCRISDSKAQQCHQGELCFQEVRQQWRKLGEDPQSSELLSSQLGKRNISHMNSDIQNQKGVRRKLEVDSAGQNLCLGIRQAANLQPCGGRRGQGKKSMGGCPAMSTCFLPVLSKSEELLKICYKAGYNGKTAAQRAYRAHLHLTSKSEQGEEFGRGLHEVVMGRSDEQFERWSSRQPACSSFIALVGNRVGLLQAVEVTNYAPAAWWVPMRLPHTIEQLLAYTFSISAALALLNMAPIYGLDGEAALRSVSQLGDGQEIFPHPSGRRRGMGRQVLRLALMNIGTAIFVLLLLLHVLRLTGYDASLMRTLATVRHLLTFSVRWG